METRYKIENICTYLINFNRNITGSINIQFKIFKNKGRENLKKCTYKYKEKKKFEWIFLQKS